MRQKKAAQRIGPRFCAVIIDEAHGITPTVQFIIDEMRTGNPKLRVVGLSATPYRLGSGYIYRMDERGNPNSEERARDPYFTARVYCIQARQLIAEGFLSQPVVGQLGVELYDTSGLQLNRRGQFDAADVDRAFVGHGRKTASIVADVVAKSRDRMGVMLFAATVQHAKEVVASLPPSLTAIVTGDTPKSERESIIKRFKARQIKYLVNVSVLTTGFDASHVDVVAILRKTESIGLLQQIIGRGLRIDPDKADCLVLDYAENIETHCTDGDLFAPEVRASYASGESVPIQCECPQCGAQNEFSARKNDEGYGVDQFGYFVDLDGDQIETDHGPMPAHHGRRCQGLYKSGATFEQCNYRWTSKKCPHCDSDQDIAARYCKECKGEIIDPNEKLHIDFKALKKDPTRLQTDEVLGMSYKPTISRAGKECIVVTFNTPYRNFDVWLHPNSKVPKVYAQYHQWLEHKEKMPKTVTYRKEESSFYTIHDYNRPADENPATTR
jgi:DNA repair protein RadD